MALENRLVRSATWEGMCDEDGCPTPKLIDYYKTLAEGGVGLIITGYCFVRPDGKQLPGKMGIHIDDFADSMRQLTDTIHKAGSKVCVQLVHAGGQTDSVNAGTTPVAPSALKLDQYPETPVELTKNDIANIVDSFGQAARRAKSYGFDAVQLHGAHGYLINQFLSSLTNKRTDNYGGSLENRSRFLSQIYDCVRGEVGADYPLLIKLNGSDFLDGGLELEDAVAVAELLDKKGINAIEVSGGTPASGAQSPARMKIKKMEQEAYNLESAREIKKVVQCPVILVGGMRSKKMIEKVLTEEQMDYISMARPFIREPGLVKRWQQGDNSPAKCISCNGCFMPGIKEGGIYCVVDKKEETADN